MKLLTQIWVFQYLLRSPKLVCDIANKWRMRMLCSEYYVTFMKTICKRPFKSHNFVIVAALSKPFCNARLFYKMITLSSAYFDWLQLVMYLCLSMIFAPDDLWELTIKLFAFRNTNQNLKFFVGVQGFLLMNCNKSFCQLLSFMAVIVQADWYCSDQTNWQEFMLGETVDYWDSFCIILYPWWHTLWFCVSYSNVTW